MKKIFLFMTAVLILAACGKNTPDVNVDGSWHLSAISSLDEGTADVWVRFENGSRFTLWQKGTGEDRYKTYNGTYAVDGETVSGKYSDGTPWGDSYKASRSADGKTLTLTAEGSKEVSTYTSTEIPETVTSNTYSTKAEDGTSQRWL